MNYQAFLENKIVAAEKYGVDIYPNQLSDILLPHQATIVPWCISGGRRAIFASFGLGKTLMQLEIAKQVIQITGKPFLIAMPLGVVGEFRRDNELLKTGHEIQYITDTDEVELELTNDGVSVKPKIYVTNYERIRKGDIDPECFGGCSLDEASIIRNLKTETANYVLQYFQKINFRFVATATPTPNDFIEILNYAVFLGVIDRGHALTRFFQRDSTKAGHLTLYPNKKDEFWKWVSTWAVFINKPSDLGFDDTGYNLPKMHLHEVEVNTLSDELIVNKKGDLVMFKDLTKSLPDVSREKSTSIQHRVNKAFEIVKANPGKRFILWHHLEAERIAIEKKFKDFDMRSIYGGQTNAEKERLLIEFSEGKYQILSTKPKIAGSGCNFQHACHNMIFVGIDYKFNDFIQAIHRTFRFRQGNECHVWMLFTNNEHEVLKSIKMKWANHIELNTEMINIVREYGLNSDKIKSDMKRQIFENRRSAKVGGAIAINNDAVLEWKSAADNVHDMILTSIPFGDHYEYSDNYNDMGHNHGNEEFFKQMDFLTPELLRCLKPGRVAAIHVKDRIRYSYQNGTSFTTIDDFSGETVAHFKKHGFHLIGKITVTTDVVRENNQTYRLGWSEQCKDASKMGVGMPEYILLFRKAPTTNDNAYADEPITKTKDEYDLATWQLDAHSYWKSNGDRFLTSAEIQKLDFKSIVNYWKKYNTSQIYDFKEHLQACKDLEQADKLSKLFMTLPTHSDGFMVWTDVNRMNTLNTNQANRKKEKHICPLQLDIIERLINRFSRKGEIVADPFGGLFSTAYKSLELERKAFTTELNPAYYDDGLFYLKSIEYKISVPTLFDLLNDQVA